MKKVLTVVLLFLVLCINAQNSIVVMDKLVVMQAGVNQEFFFSFDAGDTIEIELNVLEGKLINSISVYESQDTPIFSSVSLNKLSKRIPVSHKNVYYFKLVGHPFAPRSCNMTIRRIPGNKTTPSFSTDWKWVTIYDTVYTTYKQDSVVGNDTLHYTETVREVVSSELNEVLLVDDVVKLYSRSGLNYDRARTYVSVELPHNNSNEDRENKVIAWAYSISVGGKTNFMVKNKNSIITMATLSTLGYAALGAELLIPDPDNKDGSVTFAIINKSSSLSNFLNGKGYTYIRRGEDKQRTFGRFSNDYLQGKFYICLKNESLLYNVSVAVNAVAVVETAYYKNVEYERDFITPKVVYLTKTKMNVTSGQVRVPVN